MLHQYFVSPGTSSGMACYKCDSHNYSDPNCDDPIHPAYMKLEDNCQVPKQNHIGTFPAAFCVKIIGESENFYLLKAGAYLLSSVLVNEGVRLLFFQILYPIHALFHVIKMYLPPSPPCIFDVIKKFCLSSFIPYSTFIR